MDVHDRETRSYNMSRIRSGNTTPELVVRRECHRQGLRFRLHRKDLPGKPDLVFPRYKTAIFVHGCYWHSHECKYGAVFPKTNAEFWRSKRSATVKRDERNLLELLDRGWRVVIVWECATKGVGPLDSGTLGKQIREAVAEDAEPVRHIPKAGTPKS